MADNTTQPVEPLKGWGPFGFRVLLVFVGATYIFMVMANAAGSKVTRVLDPVLLYSVQIARLFPNSARMTIDYRVEGWVCETQEFVEIDYRPFFPIHQNNKENRFHRAMFFHRRDRPAMQALDAYISDNHNARVRSLTAASDDDPRLRMIGGIRVSSLRIPIPDPGSRVERWDPQPLEAYPESYHRHWFYTRMSERRSRCAELMP